MVTASTCHGVEWSAAERAAWLPPPEIKPSEWVEANIVLSEKTSPEPGPLNLDRTPYLREPIDMLNDSGTEKITNVFGTQLGKTLTLVAGVGYVIDKDPGPTLVVMPREPDAKRLSWRRVKPVLEDSPNLKRHIPKDSDDMTKLEYELITCNVRFAGSNSPADLASTPIRWLFMDEVDKYPKFSGSEADPVELATERTKNYWNKKIYMSSTPTTRKGYIWREYEKSDQRRYFVPCPECGEYQALVFSQVKFDKDKNTAEEIKNDRLAWYECEHCQGKITDRHKTEMLDRGVWLPLGQDITKDGEILGSAPRSRHRGYWLNSIYSPWLTFSDVAAKFLDSKDDPAKLMNFVNSWLAELWEEKTRETKPDFLKTKVRKYKMGTVPEGAQLLTAGVDVQQDHFYYVIRAWGFGLQSWLVRHNRVNTWEEIFADLFKTTYKRVNEEEGEPMILDMACIDSGYDTDLVYDVCNEWAEFARPVRGQQKLTGGRYRVSKVDRHPITGGVIEGGQLLWNIDTSYYKDRINRLIHTGDADKGDPGKFFLPEETDDHYFKQMCSEHKVVVRNKRTGTEKTEWAKVWSRAPNHYFDAEVYAAAAADMLQVSALREDGGIEEYNPDERQEGEVSNDWHGGRGRGWWDR